MQFQAQQQGKEGDERKQWSSE